MLTPSPETVKIRRIVERLSDDDLLTKGPKDLKEAVEKVGLDYDAVREKVNNELARARRKKGVRKGQGRRKAARWLTDKEFLRQVELFGDFSDFREEHFKSWAEFQKVVKQLLAFRDRFGSDAEMMGVIEMKAADEETDKRSGLS